MRTKLDLCELHLRIVENYVLTKFYHFNTLDCYNSNMKCQISENLELTKGCCIQECMNTSHLQVFQYPFDH